MDVTSEERAAYIQAVVTRDDSWRQHSACRDSGPERVAMFTCTEDEEFEILGRKVNGFDVQSYLVEAYCLTCPVQWECAREAVFYEETEGGDRSTGAWAMTRRDRRWLARQPDAKGIIDGAKWDGIPISRAVADARLREV